jgi:hypothetical protein
VAIPLQTERFYDLAGSVGFISTAIVSSFYPNFRLMLNNVKTFGLTSGRIAEGLTSEMWNPAKVLSVRQMVVGGMVILWAGRLGSFLIQASPELASRSLTEYAYRILPFASIDLESSEDHQGRSRLALRYDQDQSFQVRRGLVRSSNLDPLFRSSSMDVELDPRC